MATAFFMPAMHCSGFSLARLVLMARIAATPEMSNPAGEFFPVKLPACIALAVGLLLSALITMELWQARERAWQDDVKQLAQDRADVIHGQILRSMEVLHGMAALFEAKPDVTREEFRAFVSGSLERQPELLALAWDPLVPTADPGKLGAKSAG